MKTIRKRTLLCISFVLCVIGLVVPFLIRTSTDSLASVMSLSLTMVGTIATVVTLIIAVLLYDRFGLEGKFIEKQLDKVLELADSLKGKEIYIKIGTGEIYFMRPHQGQLKTAGDIPEYIDNCKKIVLLRGDDYTNGTTDIFAIRRSYWLPVSIKNKMNFLNIYTLRRVDVSEEKHVKLSFNAQWDGTWMLSRPEITLEEFNDRLFDLVKEIEDWIKEHSSVTIDLRLEEPH